MLDFFQYALQKKSFITFYGGEPLLTFDTIRRTVDYIKNHKTLNAKKLRYSISTNGTLLTEEILHFLNTNKFRVYLSQDGTAQDLTRPSKLNSLVLENLDRLSRLPDIEFETNSVFIPATVGELYRSARFFVERGINNSSLTYSINGLWDPVHLDQMREEVRELREYLLSYYHRHRSIPIKNFRNRPKRAVLWCSAGQDRFSLGPDGKLWGCRLFADLFADKETPPEFSKYCFGDICDFVADDGAVYSSVTQNYRSLRMDSFSSERLACRKCSRLLYCNVCPAAAAFSSGAIGKVPSWVCDMKKIWLEEITKFWEAAG